MPRVWILLAVLLALCGCGRAVAQNPQRPAAARGRDIARNVCSVCHVVTAEGEYPPVLQPPAPSFLDIANRPGVTAGNLRHFVLTTHWDMKTPVRMPDPMMRPEDASAVVAYILSLRKQPASSRRAR